MAANIINHEVYGIDLVVTQGNQVLNGNDVNVQTDMVGVPVENVVYF